MYLRHLPTVAIVALSAVALTPAMAATAKDEVELHIEASAQVGPDKAFVPVTLTGYGADQDAARADLAKSEEKWLARLPAEGIDRAKVTPATLDKGGKPVVTFDDDNPAAEAACAAASAAEDAAAAAGPAKKRKSPREVPVRVTLADYGCKDEPLVAAHKTMLVEVNDLALLDRVKLPSEGDASYSRTKPLFSQSDAAAAHRKAREQALAKARAEADAYAEAMGYRVVRMVRVSNGRPEMAINDIIGFFTAIDNRSTMMQPSWFGATVQETVAIDYVIAPK